MQQRDPYTPARIAVDKQTYAIPIYQRLFEWNVDNVTILMEDLWSAYKTAGDKNYYIGLLTMTEEHELVDGQQRFTVMMLLGCVLQKYDTRWRQFLFNIEGTLRIKFEARYDDQNYLHFLADRKEDEEIKNGDTYTNILMRDAINTIRTFLKTQLQNDDEKQSFAHFVYEHLCFFITTLPKEYTSVHLNTYFERMNTMGKNLEQHEILKVKLLRHLHNDVTTYMTLWNRLAEVNSILIRPQEGEKEDTFHKRVHETFNKNNDNLLQDVITGLQKEEEGSKITIEAIKASKEEPKKSGSIERDTYCFLTFPQLLLQTLYWYLGGKIKGSISDFFNTNNLLKTFEQHLSFEQAPDENAIREFMERLVRSKMVLDTCFIRGTEEGYTNKLPIDGDDETMKALVRYEAMLYVSSSNATNYKWFGSLMKVITNGLPTAKELLCILQTDDDNEHPQVPTELRYGNDTLRYWFWRLDFYIWQRRKELFADDQEAQRVAEEYVFRRNRSIEHIAPQTPRQESALKWDEVKDKEELHDFGNLVMISQGLNSSLQNESYEIKKAYVASYHTHSKMGSIESLKLLLVFRTYDKWDENTIIEHREKCFNILKESFSTKNTIL